MKYILSLFIPYVFFIISWLNLSPLYPDTETRMNWWKLLGTWGLIFERIESVTNCTDVKGFSTSLCNQMFPQTTCFSYIAKHSEMHFMWMISIISKAFLSANFYHHFFEEYIRNIPQQKKVNLWKKFCVNVQE